MSLDDRDLVGRAREALDRSVDDLDPATLGRLRAARRTALEGAAAPRRTARSVWAPLGALAVATLALVVGVSWWATTGSGDPPPVPREIAAPRAVEDLEVVASSDDLELYEDLEFYEWLEVTDAG